jgi:Tol biopolymer transport system component
MDYVLYRVHPDGTGLQALTNSTDRLYHVPTWSADGQWIALVSVKDPNRQVSLIRLHPDGSGTDAIVGDLDVVDNSQNAPAWWRINGPSPLPWWTLLPGLFGFLFLWHMCHSGKSRIDS